MTASPPRRARVRALAKINLSLEVLNKRQDGYHNLRTLFQTISLADVIELEWTPGRKPAAVELESAFDIPNNLVTRAAEAVFRETNPRGRLLVRLDKRIPMGGGLGGGSTDAAAVLLALPVLTGRPVAQPRLHAIATELGSDVPFLLEGGAAIGVGRGTELYPTCEPPRLPGLLVAPAVHVSTAEAYKALGRNLTETPTSSKINTSLLAWSFGAGVSFEDWQDFCVNDFESAVFRTHPELEAVKRRLQRAGARPALMTGSGAALFGLFRDRKQVERARRLFIHERAFPISLVSRTQYRSLWWKQLAEHLESKAWPLRSRYAR